MNLFGLGHYGCCESLTHKYGTLKKYIRNLRRVSVSPWTDVEVAAREMEGKYVLQWRPNPTDVIFKFTPDQMRENSRRNLELLKGCHVEVCLQDVETCNGQPERLRIWTRETKHVAEEICERR